MTLLYRFALLGLLTSLVTACETIYMDKPMQPAPIPINSQSQPVPSDAYPYQNQPQPVPSSAQPVPVQAPPVPSRAVAPPSEAPQTIDSSGGHVIPVRAPGSISDMPDPS